MASSTRRRVSERMLGWSLMTRDTVCDDTPAQARDIAHPDASCLFALAHGTSG